MTDLLPACSNHHFDQLADAAVKAIEKAGGKAYLTYPAVITDGMTMGMEGMKFSLPSRDLIANHIELMHDGYRADALLTIGGCDKTQPGALMPIVRGDHIGVTLYGGGRLPGNLDGKCPKWEDLHGNEPGGVHLDAGSAYEVHPSSAA